MEGDFLAAKCPAVAASASLRIHKDDLDVVPCNIIQENPFSSYMEASGLATLAEEMVTSPQLQEAFKAFAELPSFGLAGNVGPSLDDSALAFLLRPCQGEASVDPTMFPPFRERLQRAIPARSLAPSYINWSQLAAVDSSESMIDATENASARGAARIDVNSGGLVFFGLLQPACDGSESYANLSALLERESLAAAAGAAGHDQTLDWSFVLGSSDQEEAVVLKFSPRYQLQSEQLVSELARRVGLAPPASRLLLRSEDQHGEWGILQAAAESVAAAGPSCVAAEALAAAMRDYDAVLVLQWLPGCSMQREQQAWRPHHIAASSYDLGRLLALDLLLGNADRLAVRSLAWQGNPSNVIWHSDINTSEEPTSKCVPIDAAVARRPPRLLVQEADKKVSQLLEVALFNAVDAYKLLQEVVSCNEAAAAAVTADWEDSKQAVSSFQVGLLAALQVIIQEQGLLEMVANVLRSWLDDFHADMQEVAEAPCRRLGETRKLQRVKRAAGAHAAISERLARWQCVLRERSVALKQEVDSWCEGRSAAPVLSFQGFLGSSSVNPVVDAYELLVRLQQLVARARVMQCAVAKFIDASADAATCQKSAEQKRVSTVCGGDVQMRHMAYPGGA